MSPCHLFPLGRWASALMHYHLSQFQLLGSCSWVQRALLHGSTFPWSQVISISLPASIPAEIKQFQGKAFPLTLPKFMAFILSIPLSSVSGGPPLYISFSQATKNPWNWVDWQYINGGFHGAVQANPIVRNSYSILLQQRSPQSILWWRLGSFLLRQYTTYPGGSDGKAPACDVGDLALIPGSGRSPEEGLATHSSPLAWKTPWMEEPGRLQSMGSQRVGHNQQLHQKKKRKNLPH